MTDSNSVVFVGRGFNYRKFLKECAHAGNLKEAGGVVYWNSPTQSAAANLGSSGAFAPISGAKPPTGGTASEQPIKSTSEWELAFDPSDDSFERFMFANPDLQAVSMRRDSDTGTLRVTFRLRVPIVP